PTPTRCRTSTCWPSTCTSPCPSWSLSRAPELPVDALEDVGEGQLLAGQPRVLVAGALLLAALRGRGVREGLVGEVEHLVDELRGDRVEHLRRGAQPGVDALRA